MGHRRTYINVELVKLQFYEAVGKSNHYVIEWTPEIDSYCFNLFFKQLPAIRLSNLSLLLKKNLMGDTYLGIILVDAFDFNPLMITY